MSSRICARAYVKCVAVFSVWLFAGCSSTRKAGKVDDQAYLPRIKWYAHCEACNWCKGSFKMMEEAQRIVSEHNIKLHDWIKVAYYDEKDCRK
jgi:hypothetical protein